ncbi:NERD domain-containing protein [Schumannella soli]|uniref:NERD domain-containing protein n=2 Tax=Schumannella soli TaxID=2590779 RepID=A0A506Y598_9MICO|nr:NERD domain-containing protein [Schumannella soli]
MPAQALMEKLHALEQDGAVRWLPFGIAYPSRDWLSWFKGARGEIEVARRLAKLGDGWTVLHSVPVGSNDSDIDHVAVGPGGLFTINTKRSPDARVWVGGGTFLINGSKKPYLRNSTHEARRLEKLLAAVGVTATATPVIAVSGVKSLTVKSPPRWNGEPVEVVETPAIARRLRRRARLDADQVGRIAAALARPDTWAASERVSIDLAALRDVYDRLDRGLDRWNLLVLLVGILVAGGIAALALSMAGGYPQFIAGVVSKLF